MIEAAQDGGPPVEDQESIGIDLGTTNSLVAYIGPSGTAEILTNRDQEQHTPSVVGLPPRTDGVEFGEYLVGKLALNNARRDPRNTIRSIKRFMGLTFDDPKVQIAKQHVSYELVEDPGRDGALVVRVGNTLLTPEEVSAQVLYRMKQDAEARLGGKPVQQAVITVPAYFNEPQRRATRRAGALAGLIVKAILDEPTAAALAEYEGVGDMRQRVLVFDFGGGTLDVSLVQAVGKNLNVLSYTGDNFLGGDDIDRGIAEQIKEWIATNDGVIKEDDYRLELLLRENAEQAKKHLCGTATPFPVIIPAATRTKDGEMLDVEMDISQDDLARVLAPLEKRVRKLLTDYLREKSFQPEYFDQVLLVGGTSAVPAFKKLLQEIFEKDGQKRVRMARDPMHAVAKGAAIYSKMLQGIRCVHCEHISSLNAELCENPECGESLEAGSYSFSGGDGAASVSSRLPHSLGILYRRGEERDLFQIILKGGSVYPITDPVEETFYLPSTERFAVHIYEGDKPRASENQRICMLYADQIPADVKAGDPVAIGFAYDRDRTLLITMRFPTSKSNFEPRWRRDDQAERSPDDPQQSLMQLLPKVRSFLSEYRDYMTEGTRIKLKEDLDSAQTAITTGDIDEVKRLHTVMFNSLWHGCGTASTLFLAERTVVADDRELGTVVKEAADVLRKQCKEKDPAEETTRKQLQDMIEQSLQRHFATPQADDLRDWDIPTR